MFSSQPSPLADGELVRRYKISGDLQVLTDLFSPYTSMVYAVGLKYLKDREEAKDMVLQVFEKLITALNEHDVKNFKSWLYVMVRNQCLMQLRSQKGRRTEGFFEGVMENPGVSHLDGEPELEENLGKLEKCIAELGGEQQNCVRLFYLEEKCYKEITLFTGFDLNQVKSYIQNGKRNLKICMERND